MYGIATPWDFIAFSNDAKTTLEQKVPLRTLELTPEEEKLIRGFQLAPKKQPIIWPVMA